MNLMPDQEQRAQSQASALITQMSDGSPFPTLDLARELIYLRDEVEYLRALVKAYDESTNRRQLIAKGDGYVMLKEPPA